MVMEEQESNIELASERIPVPQIQQPKMDLIKLNSRSGVSRGKPRLRKKALHAAILKQMEFYFSDANLNKDRYLSELLKKNPYVDLDIFANFNKLSTLTTDTSRIAKALQRSTVLKVSEDGKKVCRLTPINKKEDTDECTVYVQNLPPDTDHDWLISAFSKYGTVVYVSIPRYKSNKKIKGFAFVEFDTPTSAKQCIKAFQEEGCVLPSHTSPSDLLSITTFNNENLTICNKPEQHIPEETVATGDDKKNVAKDQTKNDVHENETDQLDTNARHSLGKRKLVPAKSFVVDENGVRIKKRRTTTDQNIADQHNSDMENQETSNKDIITNRNKTVETDRKRKRKLSINDTSKLGYEGMVKRDSRGSTAQLDKNQAIEMAKSVDKRHDDSNKESVLQAGKYPVERDTDAISSNIEEKETGADERKKKKNRKKRSNFQKDITSDMMQVMAKRDWKRLRNKYLELQKGKMQQLKLHLKKTRWNYDKAGQNCDQKPKYEKDEKVDKAEQSCYGRINYTPGIIVKIEMNQPCTDLQSFKMDLKGDNCVKYIDVTHGSCEAYVRCDTAEAAQSFVQKSYEGRHLTILKDDEEKLYWNKIEQDRQEKLHNKKRFKQRGRDKLLKRAEKELGKCIKFDQYI
ncbi:PREDICTED: la-related protein 7 [Dinoponera quadriceps]|uniref:La-related protein 7 n=1 Tax=Dinoponera quadriceps TaxID=609295 RepID=A0A6P3WXA9_DINQU|nr:PREDICTED: la-related protein 7 [Dinoponera quadriceps]